MSATMLNPVEEAARVDAREGAGAATPETPEARVLASGLGGAAAGSGVEGTRNATETPAPPPQAAPARKYWDRNENGRFLPGNRGGPGNPHAHEVARLRERLILKLSNDDLDAIAEKLIAMAREGNIQAAKLLFSYAMGKPPVAPDPDRLDREECQLYRETSGIMWEMRQMARGMLPEAVLEMVREMRTAYHKKFADIFREELQRPPSPREEIPEPIMSEKTARLWTRIPKDLLKPNDPSRNGKNGQQKKWKGKPSRNGSNGPPSPGASLPRNGVNRQPTEAGPSPNGVNGQPTEAGPSRNGVNGRVTSEPAPSPNGGNEARDESCFERTRARAL